MNDSNKTAPEYVFELAREFRKNLTSDEDFLWECLRARRLHGFKFRRQHPIGRYIADFYCKEASLVIELDGKTHLKKGRKTYDRIRDEELSLRGLRVLRVTNEGLIEDSEKGSQSQSSLKFEVAPLSWFTRRPLPPVSRLRFSVPFSAQA